MSIELVPYEDLKNLLGLEETSISSYPALELLQGSVLAAIESYVGRVLTDDTYTDIVYVGNAPTTMIHLKSLPITSVSSVVSSCLGSDETLTENSDFVIDQFGIRLLYRVRLVKLTIVYSGGLEETNDLFKRAALMQISYEYQGKEQIGASYTSNEGGSVTRPELGLLKEVKRILNSEKHPLRWA
jgi:hypothetical protein